MTNKNQEKVWLTEDYRARQREQKKKYRKENKEKIKQYNINYYRKLIAKIDEAKG